MDCHLQGLALKYIKSKTRQLEKQTKGSRPQGWFYHQCLLLPEQGNLLVSGHNDRSRANCLNNLKIEWKHMLTGRTSRPPKKWTVASQEKSPKPKKNFQNHDVKMLGVHWYPGGSFHSLLPVLSWKFLKKPKHFGGAPRLTTPELRLIQWMVVSTTGTWNLVNNRQFPYITICPQFLGLKLPTEGHFHSKQRVFWVLNTHVYYFMYISI